MSIKHSRAVCPTLLKMGQRRLGAVEDAFRGQFGAK